MYGLNAILVCVEYSDILALTLPYNRHHFDRVMVVTTPTDKATMEVALANDASLYCTNAFYAEGALFNKWRALEAGLDVFGRHGALCIMDADICWPKDACAVPRHGLLQTPKRRMLSNVPAAVPDESKWTRLPFHPQQVEWAGYTQIFMGDDPALGDPPWHEINWKHAGGADSFFQAKWPRDKKIRPGFEVLHLGRGAVNWCGRVTPYLDGSVPPEASQRYAALKDIFEKRTLASVDDPFAGETF